MTRPDTDPIVAMMLAERYGKSLWWKAPPKEWTPRPVTVPEHDNSEATCARRRRLMAEDFTIDGERARGIA